MTRKRLLMIITSILVLGGLFMAFSLNGELKASKEARRNREYEVSLVRALKNSYRNIEEIRITNPEYTDKPGSWSCSVELKFTDGEKIKYILNHSLGYSINRAAVASNDDSDKLIEYHGTTNLPISIIYSDGNKEMIE